MFVTVTHPTKCDVSVTRVVIGVSVTCGVSVTFGVSVTPASQLVTLTQCGHKFLQVSVALTF